MNGLHLSFPSRNINLYLLWDEVSMNYVWTIDGRQYKLDAKQVAQLTNNLLVRSKVTNKKLLQLMALHNLVQA